MASSGRIERVAGAAPAPPARRRVLVDLSQGATEAQGLGVAAELASLLERDLVGVFVEDEALHGLASLPFARELRLPAHSWAPMDPDRLAAELRSEAERARGMLDVQCARLGIVGRFEVMRGDAASCMTVRSAGSDILVLGAPEGPAARRFGSFDRVWQAASRAEGPVVLLPHRILRRHGPIAVLLAGGAESRLDLAVRLVRATHEKLLLVLPEGSVGAAEVLERTASSTGLGADQLRIATLDALSPARIDAILRPWGERMLLLDRALAPGLAEVDHPLALVALRRVPVLLQ